eukprot:TRINITY_DN1602_c0_g1_i1.p1 TRINITY_DN1602_c0_g1~~TRINITY_DN1602_c0_g1_i1.p1  ORF type:complete len:228 (+),score=34.95 TRINITY_DN1602_c0_g1_i1:29-685(+)
MLGFSCLYYVAQKCPNVFAQIVTLHAGLGIRDYSVALTAFKIAESLFRLCESIKHSEECFSIFFENYLTVLEEIFVIMFKTFDRLWRSEGYTKGGEVGCVKSLEKIFKDVIHRAYSIKELEELTIERVPLLELDEAIPWGFSSPTVNLNPPPVMSKKPKKRRSRKHKHSQRPKSSSISSSIINPVTEKRTRAGSHRRIVTSLPEDDKPLFHKKRNRNT